MDAEKKRTKRNRFRGDRKKIRRPTHQRHKSSYKAQTKAKHRQASEESTVVSDWLTSTSKSTDAELVSNKAKRSSTASTESSRSATYKDSNSKSKASKKNESLKKRSVIQMINKYLKSGFEEGKRRAKGYVRKVLSFAVDTGYLIPADKDGTILRVSPTLTGFKLTRRKHEPEARKRRRNMRRGEDRLKKNERKALRRRTSPQDRRSDTFDKGSSKKKLNNSQNRKSDAKKAKRPKSAERKTTKMRKNSKRENKTDRQPPKKKKRRENLKAVEKVSLNEHLENVNNDRNSKELNVGDVNLEITECADSKAETMQEEVPLNNDDNSDDNIKEEPDNRNPESD